LFYLLVKRSRIKSGTCSFFLSLFLSFSGSLLSQDTATILYGIYGPDQTLCNGKRYGYFLPAGTKGDQYLISPTFMEGSVTIWGTCYPGVFLNYDVFNQQLLLRYQDGSGAQYIIEVSNAWLQSFRLGSMYFELLNLEQTPCFYQVLGEGPVRILVHWRKKLDLDIRVGSSDYLFTPAEKELYVLMDGQLRPFKTNQGLIRLFAREHGPEIKNYLRKNKVRVKKASDQAMAKLITFIGNLN